MSVTTLNPFDLLNEDAAPKTAVKKTLAAAPVAAKPVVAAAPAAAASSAKNSRAPAAKKSSTPFGSAELNANIPEKAPLRRGNNNTNTRRPAATEAEGTERQERRRTDRHSRTGYKQDSEKRMTSGKGSWGKAVEQGEEHVTVDESVAIAEAVEGVAIAREESAPTEAAPVEVVVPHLTMAQYQATLKKPAVSATSTRKVTTTLAKDQILKKESEVFVFPEIVKKAAAPAAKKAEKAAAVDLSKYISVKAVSSVEPRTERPERSERPDRNSERTGDRSAAPRNGENRRSSGNNRTSTSAPTNRTSTPKRESTTSTSTSTPSAPKMNLNDNRSFPALGSK